MAVDMFFLIHKQIILLLSFTVDRRKTPNILSFSHFFLSFSHTKQIFFYSKSVLRRCYQVELS